MSAVGELMYHATDMTNLDSIMENGIRPSKYDGMVYLASSMEDALKFVMFRGYKEILVLPVEVDYVIESFDHSEKFFGCKAYVHRGRIHPRRIVLEEARKYVNPFAFDISKLEDIGK